MTTNTSVPYGKSNAYTLLMRVPTSEATLKFSIQVSQKTKNCTTIRPSDMTPGHVANILCPTTDIYVIHLHCSFIHSNSKMELAQMSIK